MAAKKENRGGQWTPMKQAFVDALIAQRMQNPTEAARAAGYTEKSCRAQASRLMKDPLIKSEIKRRTDRAVSKSSQKEQISEQAIIEEMAAMGMANMLDYLVFDEQGRAMPKPLSELTRAQGAAIKELTIETTGQGKQMKTSAKLKLHDKHQPLRSLGQMFGLLEGDNPVVNMLFKTQQNFIGALRSVSNDDLVKAVRAYQEGEAPTRLIDATVGPD